MIEESLVQALLGRWWFNYDEGNFTQLEDLLADDARFSCRTDTGTTDYEDFVRVDVRGRDDVLAWQTQHRLASPYPLRHNATNVHLVDRRDDEAGYASYIFVTRIADGAVANLSTAIVTGRVRRHGDGLRIAAMHVVLDTANSVPFAARAE